MNLSEGYQEAIDVYDLLGNTEKKEEYEKLFEEHMNDPLVDSCLNNTGCAIDFDIPDLA